MATSVGIRSRSVPWWTAVKVVCLSGFLWVLATSPAAGQIQPDRQIGAPAEEADAPTATGDFNGDGIDDLAVGVPGESIGQIEDAGAIHSFYGEAGSDLVGAPDHVLSQDSPNVSGRPEIGDAFGATLTLSLIHI